MVGMPIAKETGVTVQALVNVLIPGAGLLLRDRLVLGCSLLLLALICVALLIVGPLLLSPDFAATSRWWLLAAYVALALLAALAWWLWEAATPLSDAHLREQHRLITSAWLQGRGKEAQSMAETLAQRGRRLPQVWDLLAVVAEPAVAERARFKAQQLRHRGH